MYSKWYYLFMYSGMRNAFIVQCFPILFHLLSGTILTLILEVMMTDPMPIKSDIKKIVKGRISTVKKNWHGIFTFTCSDRRGSPRNVSFVILLWCWFESYQLVLYQICVFPFHREAAPQFPWKLNFSFQSLDLNLQNLNVSNSTLSFNKYDRDFDHKSLTLTFTQKLILTWTVSMVMTLTVTLLLRLIQILNLIQIQSWQSFVNALQCLPSSHSEDELSSLARLERRTTEDSSWRRVMRLMPVFTLETNKQTNDECLPKFVQTDNASFRIKTVIDANTVSNLDSLTWIHILSLYSDALAHCLQ